MTDLQFAEKLASRVLDEATLEHARRVSYKVRHMEDSVSIVAMLHDVLEDSSLDIAGLRALGFSEEVLLALASITRVSGEPYGAYIQQVSNNKIARRVKIVDLLDNLIERFGTLSSKTMIDRYTAALSVLLKAEYDDA